MTYATIEEALGAALLDPDDPPGLTFDLTVHASFCLAEDENMPCICERRRFHISHSPAECEIE